ncbi:hypothetical protein AB0L06_02805 [Spirillospora sp. NPDC052269]
MPLPAEVARPAGWQDVPYERRGDHYVQFLDEDQLTAVSHGGYAFTTAALFFPLHVDLPDVPASADSDDLASVAAAYIEILAPVLNDAVGPAIEPLKPVLLPQPLTPAPTIRQGCRITRTPNEWDDPHLQWSAAKIRTLWPPTEFTTIGGHERERLSIEHQPQ